MIGRIACIALSGVALLSMVSGCGRKSDGATRAAGPAEEAYTGTWPSSNAVPADRLEWRRRTLVAAYDEAGAHDARWDAAAREGLEAFALIPLNTDTNADARFEAGIKRAMAAGCEDLLIRYLNLRFEFGTPQNVNAAGADAYREVADKMMHSGYPDIRKCVAALRAAEAWKQVYGSSSNSMPVLSHLRRGAFFHLQPALREPDIPFSEAYMTTAELCRAIYSNSKQESDMLPVIIDCFLTRWPTEARAMTLCGRANTQLGWSQRGSGYANTVTRQGWKEFARYLEKAERLLERSWETDPKLVDTAVAMMQVELGQGRGRDRLELWFQRAMTLDPACYDAASAKAWYLQPKWYGSREDAIGFGRECVESKQWKGRVPLTLLDVHEGLANDLATGLKDAHWNQRGVWEDVRDSFERFFELNPDATGWRHNYALYAYKCGQFDAFLDQLPRMGWVNHPYFGGEVRFNEMVAEAERKTGRKATLPK